MKQYIRNKKNAYFFTGTKQDICHKFFSSGILEAIFANTKY